MLQVSEQFMVPGNPYVLLHSTNLVFELHGFFSFYEFSSGFVIGATEILLIQSFRLKSFWLLAFMMLYYTSIRMQGKVMN